MITCSAWHAVLDRRYTSPGGLQSCIISFTRRLNGPFLVRISVLFWYFLISRRAFVPGRYLCFFRTVTGRGRLGGVLPDLAAVADRLRNAASWWWGRRGALPPVVGRGTGSLALCVVRAMLSVGCRGCTGYRGGVFGVVGVLYVGGLV